MKENAEAINTINAVFIPLVSKFLNGDISAWNFAQAYFDTMRDDPTISYKTETFAILQAIFEDCDAYWPDGDALKDSDDIGEEELRRCCTVNLEKLKKIVE